MTAEANAIAPQLIPAAEYVRMSTEHQQYSTENQGDVIREYARKRGYQIVKTYADDGKSGLQIKGRDSLRQLIDDVQTGTCGFSAVLVYDVSRWGRFQDTDESAYYEYICKRAGIHVVYCAEQFENDGSPVSTIIKGVKRAMAGEYSRELSSKVFKGQCKLIQLGFRQGGPAGYGLRRMLIDQSGQHKSILHRGEQKSLQTDRVILVPGPEEEQQVVHRIYRLFTSGMREAEIAGLLNAERIVPEAGEQWSRSMVHQILTNEKYIGNNVYNRISFKLKRKRVRNTPEMWIRGDHAFEPIVDPSLFFMARGIIHERHRTFTTEEMLLRLRELFEKAKHLSARLIDSCEEMPSSSVYRTRFGGLVAAYRAAGYEVDKDYSYLEVNQRLRRLYPEFIKGTQEQLARIGASVDMTDRELIHVNGEYTVSVLLTRCRPTQAGSLRWRVRPALAPADISVVVRMDESNESPADFYLLPWIDIRPLNLRLRETNGFQFDAYRFETLEYFYAMSARIRAKGVA